MNKTVKYTDGVLCRDKDLGGDVVFFPGHSEQHVYLDVPLGWWLSKRPRVRLGGAKVWVLGRFKTLYDLRDENGKPCAPPRKGRCFECEVEL